MRTQVELSSGLSCSVDLHRGIDISIPLNFQGPQPSAFGAPTAHAQPLSLSGYVLDTEQGGSCNVATVSLTPHCNGTHTESVRHITTNGPAVVEVAPTGLVGTTLITVLPELGSSTSDDYLPNKRANDLLITRRALEPLERVPDESFLSAVVIRTLPNDRSKLGRNYDLHPGPYFSAQAIEHLIRRGVSHLLVDTASIDRSDDEGVMLAHHLWFGVPEKSVTFVPATDLHRTITEMVYVGDTVNDGSYLMALHVAPFMSDAAPSRPILFSTSLKAL